MTRTRFRRRLVMSGLGGWLVMGAVGCGPPSTPTAAEPRAASDSPGDTATPGVPGATSIDGDAPMDASGRKGRGPQKDVPRYRIRFEHVRTVRGPLPASGYGLILSIVGDVDGDGSPEWATRDDGTVPPSVRVHSGRSGQLLLTLTHANPAFGDHLSGVGDLDGDGRADLLVGATPPASRGQVSGHSGRLGSLLFTLDEPGVAEGFGRATGMGDVNGDGSPDFAVSADSATVRGVPDVGRVDVYSGAARQLLYTLTPEEAVPSAAYYGSELSSMNDIDGDGVRELLVGAYIGVDYRGSVYVHSGATGALLHRFDGEPDAAPLAAAFSLSGLDDVDGDGTSDIAVGCLQCSPAARREAGYVAVYSGKTGQRIHRFEGATEGAGMGYSVAGLGDLDGDGAGELALGVPGNPFFEPVRGAVEVRSGRTGESLWRADSEQPGGFLGARVMSADFDGDGLQDLLVTGDLTAPSGGAGEVHLLKAVREPLRR